MNRLTLLNLTDISPDPKQPRKTLHPKRLQELADNIKANGVLQPITVRPAGKKDGRPHYTIVTGERRWAASSMAGKETIQALIAEDPETITPDAVFYHQLSENLHRENLNPLEKAEFLNTRIDMLRAQGCTDPQTALAEELGSSPSWVNKSLAILKLGEDVRDIARKGLLRGYPNLKRLAELKGKKRQEAIQAIHDGTFNPATLAPRKRKSKTAAGPITQDALFPDEWVKLIEATPFAAILDAEDPQWRVNIADSLDRLRTLLTQSA